MWHSANKRNRRLLSFSAVGKLGPMAGDSIDPVRPFASMRTGILELQLVQGHVQEFPPGIFVKLVGMIDRRMGNKEASV